MDFKEYLANNWIYFAITLAIIALMWLFMWLLAKTRSDTRAMLTSLLRSSPSAYVERLENNRRLRTLFRPQALELMKLDGYMALDERTKAESTIALLDSMKLEPGEKVDFLQKRLSYFISVHENDKAVESCESLCGFLRDAGAQDNEKYAEIIAQAQMLVKIYVEHDVSCIEQLKKEASSTKNDVVRGVTQYRIAKLAHYANDEETVAKYLRRALKNVEGTYYYDIVKQAMENPKILEEK